VILARKCAPVWRAGKLACAFECRAVRRVSYATCKRVSGLVTGSEQFLSQNHLPFLTRIYLFYSGSIRLSINSSAYKLVDLEDGEKDENLTSTKRNTSNNIQINESSDQSSLKLKKMQSAEGFQASSEDFISSADSTKASSDCIFLSLRRLIGGLIDMDAI